MSTLSVTNIITANDTTDLTLKTGNTSGPELVLSANGATSLNNIQTLSVGNSTVNTVMTSTNLSVGNSTVNSFINSSSISIGNSTVNTVMTSTNLSVGNSTVNTAISSGNIAINGQNISPTMSFRNVIINGNFDFWQRGTSTTTAGYLADRWTTQATGSTFTTSRQSFTVGQTDVPNNPTYFHRTVVVSSAGASNFVNVQHRVENAASLSGQTVTLSFYGDADASKNIAVEFVQNFGTGGSPSAEVTTIGVTTVALTTSWAKHTVTATLPSVSGKTFGSDNNSYLAVVFWFDAGSDFNSRTNSLGQQSGTFDIAQVQLEQGSVATPFELRPLGTELALCQRYFEVGGGYDTSRTAASAVGATTVVYAVQKRAVPTLSITITAGTTGSIATQHQYGFSYYAPGGSVGDYSRFTFTSSAEL